MTQTQGLEFAMKRLAMKYWVIGLIMMALLCLTACTNSSNVTEQTTKNEVSSEVAEPIPTGKPYQLEINGLKQTIMVQANNPSNPILLILHGGPGYAMLPVMHKVNPELENEFTVVNWDQRGAGLSPETDVSKMTLAQFVDDAHKLTLWLKEKFGQKKIYILGHSFGTVLGIELLKQYPDDYYAFVGVGQTVSVAQNEQYAYDWALAQAKRNDDQDAMKILGIVGRPTDAGDYPGTVPDEFTNDFKDGFEVTSYYVGLNGGDMFGLKGTDSVEQMIYNSGVYNEESWGNGWTFSQGIFNDKDVFRFNFKDPSQGFLDFKVPVYFFMGQHDYDTPVNLFEEYYALITSKKNYIKFEKSAHFPFLEEPEKFREQMIQVKKDTY